MQNLNSPKQAQLKKANLSTLAILGLLLTFPLGIQAKQIAKKDKWSLHEIEVPGSGLECVAMTSQKEKKSTYTLEVHKLKNSQRPTEIFLREKGRSQVGQILYKNKNVNGDVVLFSIISVEKDQQMYWLLPDEMPMLEHNMKTEGEFDLKSVFKGDGQINDIDFSLKGAAQMLTLMSQHCNGGRVLMDPQLHQFTNHGDFFDQNPHNLSIPETNQLRSLYFSLAATFNALKVKQSELAAVLAKYKPYQEEQSDLINEDANLRSRKIPQIKEDQITNKNNIVLAKTRLAQLVTEIPAAQRRSEALNAATDLAYGKIAPLIPEHDRLSAEVSRAQSDLARSESDLQFVDQKIRENRRAQDEVFAELGRLNLRIDQMRQRLRELKQSTNVAKQRLDNFDEEKEIEARMVRVPGYAQKSKAHHNLIVALRANVKESDLIKDKIGNIDSRLSLCRRRPAPACDKLKTERDELVTQKAVLDEEIALKQAEIEESNKELDVMRAPAKKEVAAVYRDRRQAYEQAYRDEQEHENRVVQVMDKKRDVEQDGKDLENIANRLLDERDSVERTIASVQTYVNTTIAAVKNYEASTNYVNKMQVYTDAKNRSDSADSNLAGLKNEQYRMTDLKSSSESNLVRLADELVASEARLITIKDRLTELSPILAQLAVERAPIDQNIEFLQKALQTDKQNYLNILN